MLGKPTSNIRNAQDSDGAVLNDSTVVWQKRGGARNGTSSTVGERIALRTEVVRRTGLEEKHRGVSRHACSAGAYKRVVGEP